MVEAVDGGVGAGQQDGGMGGDDKLGMAGVSVPGDDIQQFQLAARREGGFGFVQQVDALFLVAGAEIRHDGLAVGLGDQGFAAEMLQLLRVGGGPFIKNGSEVLEGFGAEIGAGYLAVGPLHGQTIL